MPAAEAGHLDESPGGMVEPSTSFLERVTAKNATLRQSEQKVAAFIAEHSSDVARLSITEVARRSGVSESTVNRLSRTLGYSGYPDMKIALVGGGLEPHSTIRNIPREIEPGDSLPIVAQKLSHSLSQALSNTMATLSMLEVQRTVESMIKADRVLVFGIGGSGYVADIAHHLFLKAGIMLSAISDGYLEAVNAALVTPRDLVIGISHSGETRDVVSALRLAKSKGATTVALTGNPNAALIEHSDIRLITISNEEPIYGDFMEAKIEQLFVIDLLYIGVLLRDVPMFTRNLDATARAIWDRSGGPWADWHDGSGE
jgi:RpiR family carbohydrate utilization transcriptional regulator